MNRGRLHSKINSLWVQGEMHFWTGTEMGVRMDRKLSID